MRILFFGFTALALAACDSTDDAALISAPSDSEELAYVANEEPSNPCGSNATYQTIKEIMFDEAVDQLDGDPVPINNLRRSAAVTMKFPRVTGSQPDLERTDCAGRLVIGIPPAARRAFDDERELNADIEYSVQPAADGSGDIVMVDGIQFLVSRIVAAENFRAINKLASQGGPQLERTFNPSFDCGPGLANVERMICQNQTLASKDRHLSEAFNARLHTLSGADRTIFLSSQRSALAERADCADLPCVNDWYDYQLSLYN